ncbi:nucleoside kinase [Bacteroidales bacterium OttesenSCG-928-C19]|nr:nucleoside kinase [Bacteroidales bacterium OttesenSCG-928-C19]
MVEIVCKNTNLSHYYPEGKTLLELTQELDLGLKYPVLGALVNNRVRDLSYRVYTPKTIEFFDLTYTQGSKMYNNSLGFLLYKAVMDLYPEAAFRIEHSVTNGFYCEVDVSENQNNEEMLPKIKQRMNEIVAEDLPFVSKIMQSEEAYKLFDPVRYKDKLNLMKSREKLYISIQSVGGVYNKISSRLVPSTGILKTWELHTYYNGFVLAFPNPENLSEPFGYKETPKLFKIFREHREWVNVLKIPYIYDLNKIVEQKRENSLIHISEAFHEKKIAKIADEIYQDRDHIKIILIAGPSSSGKTTTCKRLSVQLSVLGFKPQQLSLDNYFVNRVDTPLDENGEYDFEVIEALDLELLNSNILDLLAGKRIEVPKFDFHTGERYYDGETLCLEEKSLLVMEGIHGLNPKLTAQINEKLKYRIYVSAITQIAIDDQNLIRSSDNRLIRRIVRDYKYRGYSAVDTLKRWDSVARGEKRNIFPYQENADSMFNSASLYELGVLKTHIEPLLKMVPENADEYAESIRLLDFLSLFKPISDEMVPPTSILREFLGSSSYNY